MINKNKNTTKVTAGRSKAKLCQLKFQSKLLAGDASEAGDEVGGDGARDGAGDDEAGDGVGAMTFEEEVTAPSCGKNTSRTNRTSTTYVTNRP